VEIDLGRLREQGGTAEMKRYGLVVGAVCVLALTFASISEASDLAVSTSNHLVAKSVTHTAGTVAITRSLSAALTPAQVVSPQGKSVPTPTPLAHATGTFAATLNGDKLTWKIEYGHLGKALLVIADIHSGKAGRFGPVLVRLCGPCANGQKGVKAMTGPDATALRTSSQFITFITNQYPNGAVRGQIKVG
jgi:hypothetical protein